MDLPAECWICVNKHEPSISRMCVMHLEIYCNWCEPTFIFIKLCVCSSCNHSMQRKYEILNVLQIDIPQKQAIQWTWTRAVFHRSISHWRHSCMHCAIKIQIHFRVLSCRTKSTCPKHLHLSDGSGGNSGKMNVDGYNSIKSFRLNQNIRCVHRSVRR